MSSSIQGENGFKMERLKLQVSCVMPLVLSGIALYVTPAFGQPPNVASVVEQFHPKILSEFPDEIRGRQQCFAVYDADASGAPRTIVAAYTNHTAAAVRVLQARAGGFEVVAEPASGLGLTGVWCDITLEDLDADGRKEILVDFSVNRDTVSWVFRWDGQQLLNMTPTTAGAITGYGMSNVVNGDLVDVDNDGTKEIYVSPSYPRFPDEPIQAGVLYRLESGQYVEEMQLVGMWSLTRKTGTLETSTMTFAVPEVARGPYMLRVVNGRPDRTARATNVQLWIDGREILAPTDFGGDAAIIEREVALAGEHRLAVRFAGQPSGEILIIIGSKSWKR